VYVGNNTHLARTMWNARQTNGNAQGAMNDFFAHLSDQYVRANEIRQMYIFLRN
jgi:hypothetical protein